MRSWARVARLKRGCPHGGVTRAHYRLGAEARAARRRWGRRSVHLDADGDGWACGWDLGLGALLEEVDDDDDKHEGSNEAPNGASDDWGDAVVVGVVVNGVASGDVFLGLRWRRRWR